jgi:hypothetical protein
MDLDSSKPTKYVIELNYKPYKDVSISFRDPQLPM